MTKPTVLVVDGEPLMTNIVEIASTVGTKNGNTIIGTLTKPFQLSELEALLKKILLPYQ